MRKPQGMPAGETQDADVTVWGTFWHSSASVKTLLAGVLLSRFGGFLNVFAVPYLTSRGYSNGQASLAVGAYGVGAVAGVLLGGVFADRAGARASTVAGMGATAVLTASLLYLPWYPILLAVIVLTGLAAQLYRPASAALLSDLTPRRSQVMIFAMYRFGLNAGAMAAPLVGLGLYRLGGHGYTLVFWGEALIALVYAVVAALALPRAHRTGVAPTALGTSVEGEHAAGDSPAGGFRAVLRDRRFVLYLLATLVNGIVYVQYLSTLPMDIEAHHIDLGWYSAAVSLNGLLVILIELPLTKVSQRWPTRLTVGACFGLIGVGVGLYGLPMGVVVIIGATLVWTVGEVIGGPAVFAYPANAGPVALRSRYISTYQFMQALGTAVGPVVGGLLFVRMGHASWPLLGAGGLVAAALALAAVRAPGRSAAPPVDGGVRPATGGVTAEERQSP